MCWYNYVYYHDCQHGELTCMTYCDKAKELGQAERDRLSQRSHPPLSQPATFSSTSNHNAFHSQSQQQQHRSMAALSAPHPHTIADRVPTPFEHNRLSAQHVAVVPRSARPEPHRSASTNNIQQLASTAALQALQVSDHDGTSDNADDDVLLLSSKDSHQSPKLSRDTYDEINQESSEGSIDIIVERQAIARDDIRSASPRKPLPKHWLSPPISPALPVMQRTPNEREAVRVTRSLHEIDKPHAGEVSFLTKEALAAVDANLTMPTLRRNSSKTQFSPTKVPWTSPCVSSEAVSPRHIAGSPSQLSPSPRTDAGTRGMFNHRRVPSSVTSVGATSYHTAHGSPVRSPAGSQRSSSPSGDSSNETISVYFDCLTDVAFEQVDECHKSSKTGAAESTTGVQKSASRPRLSTNNTPLQETVSDTRKRASKDAASRASDADTRQSISSRLNFIDDAHLQTSTIPSSRIPRMPMGKVSTAHAPTLSSTLKQTKSAHQLPSAKASQGKAASNRVAIPRSLERKPLRQVRTLDSKGSTPILSDRRNRDTSAATSVSSLATVSADRTVLMLNTDVMNSYLQDVAVQTIDLTQSYSALFPLSRTTSTSTVKATQTDESVAAKGLDNVHSSDADDEYDASTISATTTSHDQEIDSPIRGRSSNTIPNDLRMDPRGVHCQSTSSSGLRATASEFVPNLQNTVEYGSMPPPKIHQSDDSTHGYNLSGLPDWSAPNAYGIPWFYYMYPVPVPVVTKGRSTSPKKSRNKKQHSIGEGANQVRYNIAQPVGTGGRTGGVDVLTTQTKSTSVATPATNVGKYNTTPSEQPIPGGTSDVGLSTNSFSAQLDEVSRQATLHTGTSTQRMPHGDLTAVRNVPDDIDRMVKAIPAARRHRQYRTDNGLYGDCGNIGVPLDATAPFPIPTAPIGPKNENFFCHTIGAKACGITTIGKAWELGGLLCNNCKPNH